KVSRDGVDEGRSVAGAEDPTDIDVGDGGIHMDLPQGIAVHAFYDIHQRLVVKEHLARLPAGGVCQVDVREEVSVAIIVHVQGLTRCELDNAPPGALLEVGERGELLVLIHCRRLFAGSFSGCGQLLARTPATATWPSMSVTSTV